MNRNYLIHFIILFTSIFILLNACTFDESDSIGPGPVGPNTVVPNSPSPTDGAINVANFITVSWNSIGASSYDVKFDSNNPPKTLVANNITDKFTNVIAPGSGRTYYWQVIAKHPDGSTTAGPVWSFITALTGPVSPGYIMILHELSTEPPSNVKVLFQVLDLADKGVPFLNSSNFEIYEDGEIVTDLESKLKITKSDENDFVFQTLLMLDNSTSITNDPSEPNNLDILKDAAKYFVNNITPIQEIAVYEFSSDAQELIDFTGSKNSGKITNAIDKMNVGSPSTDLYGATITGADRLEYKITASQIIQSAMVLFTDGDDTQGSHTLTQALNSIYKKSVYTVGLGTDVDPEILALIGNEGYFQIAEIDDLQLQFAEIQKQIVLLANSFYWMEYVSPKRGNYEHKFHLRIKNNPVNSYIEETFTSAGFVDPVPGIYFNTSVIFPYGKTSYNLIADGDEIQIQVTSIGGTSPPRYDWNLPLFPAELIMTGHNADYSVVSIKAAPITTIPPAVTTVTVTVEDVPNNDAMNTFLDNINFVIYPN